MSRLQAGVSFTLGVVLTLGLLVPSAASAHRVRVAPKFAQGHIWRQGVVPRRDVHGATSGSSGTNMSYGGGISDGTNTVGVTTGAPQVYLIFWGSQWGSQSTDSAGNYTYSGDSKGMAPDLQSFFKGVGTGGETWSGVMTQYCQGVSTGTQSCPSSSQHVGYPTGGALAGVWEDTSTAAPSQASAHQIAVEAVNAAGHFGNTTQNSNRNTQYVIISPTGTHPDGFNTFFGQFCAWHDYSADSSMSGGAATSPYGWVAFTNLPYVTDAGASCGQNFVNSGSAGTLDGVTIVEGHEYAETVTDQYPAGGWTDSSGNENGDKCAWINSSTSGATAQSVSQNITLSTGTFAVQSTWANDTNGGSGGCLVSHPVITSGPSVSVGNPGPQSNTAGDQASLQMNASEGSNPCSGCTFTASGLPVGLSISSSGLITGQVSKAGTSTVTVTATDPNTGSGYSPGSTSFTWAVSAGPASSLTISPLNPTVGVGGTQLFTASAKDAYQNPVNASATTWSTAGGVGSVPATASSSTTFTASSPGSGTVTATLGTLSASTGVTVTAAPANAIVNGGFESGAWTPWSTSGAYTALLASMTSCHAGSYCAQIGNTSPTNGDSSVSQSFTAPSNSSSVSFYYKVVCPDTVRYDWATATLKDTGTRTTYTVLGKTCSNTGAWAKASHSVTAGHSYTLTLTSHDDNYPGDPTYTLYDDVSVQ